MVDAAVDASVERFVLISSAGAGGDVDNPLNYVLNNVLVWKWLGEDYLRDSGLAPAVLRPGNLSDDPGGVTGIDVLQIKAMANQRRIPRADVAEVAVYCLTSPDCENKTFELYSDLEGPAGAWKTKLGTLKTDNVTKMAPARR